MMLRWRLCLLVGLVAAGCLAQQPPPAAPPASPYCKWTARHSLCQFQATTTADNCQSLLSRGVDDRSRQSILQAHNTLRSLIASGGEQRGAPGPQPPASNMQILTWDAELERVAQAWADQCTFEHDCSQCRRVDRFLVGQNLALETTTGPARPANWKKMITSWYEEVELFPNATVRRYQFSPATGHYSALVWADTNRIGCGFSSYSRDGRRFNLYVCDYGPAGNFIGLPVYKSGAACSQCPNHFICSAEFPNLCEPTKKPLGPPAPANAIPGTESGGKAPQIPPPPPTPAPVTARPPARPPVRPPPSDRRPISNSINNGINNGGTDGNNKSGDNSASASTTRADSAPLARPAGAAGSATATTTRRPSPLALGARQVSERSFTCAVGRGQCRASYVGTAWAFRKDSAQEFLESTVAAGQSTELRLAALFPAPATRQICLNLRLRQAIDNRSGQTLRLSVPSTTVLLKPQNGATISILLDSGSHERWLQVGLTVSGLAQPYQLVVGQQGPRADQSPLRPAAAANSDGPAVDLRLALHSLTISDGPCP